MPQYRLFLFRRNGDRRAEVGIAAEDDEHAVRIVNEHSHGHLMELRQGKRLVKRFEAGRRPHPEREENEPVSPCGPDCG